MRFPRPSLHAFGSLLATLLLAATPAAAQTGTIAGRVVDAETGAPLAIASVQLVGPDTPGTATNAQGEFEFTVQSGTYSLVVLLIGYEAQRVDGIRLGEGGAERVEVRLRSRSFVLNPLIVTASRREEKALDAPASVATVGTEVIRSRTALTPIEHVKAVAGLDIVQSGVQQGTVVARGFNNVFSGSLLVLTDNRIASVPSLRFNAYNMIPSTQLDLERIEVVLGPGAALYGPNSASGVMHMITASPIDDDGTRLSLAGGERSIFQGAFRFGQAYGDNLGFKVSGSYFQGDDWEFEDPVEVRQRTENPDNPRIGARDFNAEKWSLEARLDFRPDNQSDLIFAAGINHAASSIEMTGLGAAQAVDWQYRYLQARYGQGRFFSQIFLNSSDAGDTYLLRTGAPIVDRSYLLVGQLQHGFDLNERQGFIYGLDLQRTEPRTEGTVTGRHEDDDTIHEVGGYLHSETRLTDRFDFVGAIRLDHHNRLEDLVFSPRAALVFRPQEEQNLRLTFNRAFSTPTTNNLFLDIVGGQVPLAPGFAYDVRVRGVPPTGFTFAEECAGGLGGYCMRSIFHTDQLPANAWVLWNGMVNQLVPAELRALLLNPGQQPGDPTSYTSIFRRFDQEQAALDPALAFPVDAVGPVAIDRLRPTITNTIEVGYKGILGERFLLSADVHWNKVNDFVGPLRVETPSVFLNPADVQGFVLHRLGPLLQAGFVSEQEAAQIIQGLSSVPTGTVAPDQSNAPDLLLTYRNFGDVSFMGLDLAGQFLLDEAWTLSGTASFVNKDCFAQSERDDCGDPFDIALNAPRSKGSAAVRWLGMNQALSVEGQVRVTAGFPANSGVYVGRVEGYTILDGNASYRLAAFPGAAITVTATNLLNNERREFVGAPEVGRMLLLRFEYSF